MSLLRKLLLWTPKSTHEKTYWALHKTLTIVFLQDNSLDGCWHKKCFNVKLKAFYNGILRHQVKFISKLKSFHNNLISSSTKGTSKNPVSHCHQGQIQPSTWQGGRFICYGDTSWLLKGKGLPCYPSEDGGNGWLLQVDNSTVLPMRNITS